MNTAQTVTPIKKKASRSPGDEKWIPGSRMNSVADVQRYFAANRDRHAAYVIHGFGNRLPILAVHISDLATVVGVTLQRDGRSYRSLAERFCSPDQFDNMPEVVEKARPFLR